MLYYVELLGVGDRVPSAQPSAADGVSQPNRFASTGIYELFGYTQQELDDSSSHSQAQHLTACFKEWKYAGFASTFE